MVSRGAYLPKGYKRKAFTMKKSSVKIFKIAQAEGGYERDGDILDDLVSNDSKKRCKAQKAILKARKSV